MSGSEAKIESGFQLFSRLKQRPRLENIHPKLFPEEGPFPNQIIQITGDSSSGKTILLTELIARCILPKTINENEINCKNAGAILINTDHHFNIIKLMTIMESILTNNAIPSKDIQNIIQMSLKNLIILNCYSSEQLKITFLNLERILSDNFNINFLAIDSIFSYFWYDQYKSKMLFSHNLYCVNILNDLKKVIADRNIVTAFTKFETDASTAKPLNMLLDYTILLKKIGDKINTVIVYNHSTKKQFQLNYLIGNCFQFID